MGNWWAGTRRAEGRDRAPAPRIAVLPLANISPDSADAYLAAGFTAELAATLTRVEGLTVVPRATVEAFAGRGLDLAALGRELQAGAVLDGTVQKLGERIRVSLQLVDPRTGEALWAEGFDGTADGAFDLQRRVGGAVTGALAGPFQLAGAAREGGASRADPAAYDRLLRAEYWMARRRGEAEFDSARSLLREAVRLDPGFASAHATLALNESNRIFYLGPDPAAEQEAWVAIRRAIELDSTNEAAYLARASLAFSREAGWRHDDALRDLVRVVREHPRSVEGWNQLGSLALHIGLLDTALAALRTAVNLDPRNTFAPLRIVRTLWYLGRPAEAVDAARRMGMEGWEVANALQRAGRPDSALALLDRVGGRRAGVGTPLDDISTRAVALAALGRQAEAEGEVARVKAAAPDPSSHFHHVAYNLAAAHALLGQPDEAMRWLRATAEDGMPNYPLFARDPNLAALRDDPVYRSFLAGQRARWERFRAIAAE